MKTLRPMWAFLFCMLAAISCGQALGTGTITVANANLTGGSPSTWSTSWTPTSGAVCEVWTPLSSTQTSVSVQITCSVGATYTALVRDTVDTTMTTGGYQGQNVPNPAIWNQRPSTTYANEAGGNYGIPSGASGTWTISVHGVAADLTLSVVTGSVTVKIVPTSGTQAAYLAPVYGTLTDASGTIATGGVSQQVFAVNLTRIYIMIQNNSSGILWINFTTAAAQNQPSYQLAPNGVGIFYMALPGPMSTQAINIIGATTGQAFTAKQM